MFQIRSYQWWQTRWAEVSRVRVSVDEDLLEYFLYPDYSIGGFGHFERLLGCSIVSARDENKRLTEIGIYAARMLRQISHMMC